MNFIRRRKSDGLSGPDQIVRNFIVKDSRVVWRPEKFDSKTGLRKRKNNTFNTKNKI